MKRRQVFLGGLLMLVPTSLFASLGKSYPKRDVSGKVVDIDKRRAIIVLGEHKGWDREQMSLARVGAKAAVRRWLDGVDPRHAAIYLKREDVSEIKKGDRIRIADYSYAFAGYGNGAGADVLPLYDKLEILPK